MREWIERHNKAGRGIYFHVNPRIQAIDTKAAKSNIASLAWLHVDVDPEPGQDIDDERKRILSLFTDNRPDDIPEPTLLLFSGGGYQAFWRLGSSRVVQGQDKAIQEAELYNKQMEIRFDGDNCFNIDRVMRLPGTINWPTERKKAKGQGPGLAAVVSWTDKVYELGDFTPANAKSVGEPARPRRQSIELSGDIPRLTPDDIEALPMSDWHKVIIVQGYHPEKALEGDDQSPSAWQWAVSTEFARQQRDNPQHPLLTDEVHYAILTDPDLGISDTIFKNKNKSAADRYARRQITRAKEEADEQPRIHPPILLSDTNIKNIVSGCENALLTASLPIYRSVNGRLVRIQSLDSSAVSTGSTRHAGLVEIAEVSDHYLTSELSEHAVFLVEGAKGLVPCQPNLNVARHVKARADESNFPVLRAISMTPTLDRDEPGYDEETGVYLAYSVGDFPTTPSQPTMENAQAALARLREPISKYPWADAVSESVALSMMLCSIVPRDMAAVPVHAIDANAPGSGKSKLAEIAGILGTGVKPSLLTYTGNEEEDEKRLGTLLRSGDPIIVFDNVSRLVQGDLLCTVISNENAQIRVLGKSERERLDTRTLVVLTGNNLQFKGDICRRVVHCRLDAGVEDPHTREFDFDPVDMVRRNRAQYVADCLTILRAARQWDYPLSPFGSFEPYNLVRRALVGLGLPDPAQSTTDVLASDTARQDRAELFAAWAREFGTGLGAAVTAKQVFESPLRPLVGGDTARGVGMWLNRRKDVICGRYVLRRGPGQNNTNQYWLDQIGGASDSGPF